MSVNAIDSTTLLGTTLVESSGSTSTSDSSTTIDSGEFLTLLICQLKNQDPLDPMDTDQMTSELCDLSQLEATETTNAYLENLQLYNSSINNGLAMECIGKTVSVSGNTLSVTDIDAGDLSFQLAGDAGQVEIMIYNEQGEEVRSISLGDLESGTHSIAWDGKDSDGCSLSDGTYNFAVAAYDSNGDSIEVTTFVTSEVYGVNYRDGGAYLTTACGEIAYGDITSVNMS